MFMSTPRFAEGFPENVGIRIDFYYCLLVALGLSKKQGRVASSRQKNAFILKWLKNARSADRFSQYASSEIEWLRQEILRRQQDNDPEPMLRLIYQSARQWHYACA